MSRSSFFMPTIQSSAVAVVVFLLTCVAVEGAQREATPAVVNPVLPPRLRSTISLDGKWEFATDKDGKGEAAKWFEPAASLPNAVKINVPGCWEAQGIGGPGKSTPVNIERYTRRIRGTYMGTAWYRKAVKVPAGWADKKIWLKIGGVNSQGWFWVNGVYVGTLETYCGTYKYDISDLVKAGDRCTIVVKVRNDVTSGKGLYAYVHRFGGLYRSVELEATSSPSIDYAYVRPDFDKSLARVCVTLRKTGSRKREAAILAVKIVDAAGNVVAERKKKVSLTAVTTDVVEDIPVPNPRHWTPETPHLYTARMVLSAGGKDIDDWNERFGIRKIEVRQAHFYLNNYRYFFRGYGDDCLYPITLSPPASRDEYRKNLKMARAFGFNYSRFHTHCPPPELFEAADEIGMMLQPELPYYGARPSGLGKNTQAKGALAKFFRPEKDLGELIKHYRRHVSLTTYCMGNEALMGLDYDLKTYKLAKQLDPTRLVLHQDGPGGNVPGKNSDFVTTGFESITWRFYQARFAGKKSPAVLHEWMGLTVYGDPRDAHLYTGAVVARSLNKFKAAIAKRGLSWKWGEALIESGFELQSLWGKRAIEQARLDPDLDGYHVWIITKQPLNQFWQPKRSSPKYYNQFNGPTVILAEISSRILVHGQTATVRWSLSNLAGNTIEPAHITWKLVAGKKVLDSGVADCGQVVNPGEFKHRVAVSAIKAPALQRPVEAKLHAEINGSTIANEWSFWLFPKQVVDSSAGKGIVATPALFKNLSPRYPRLGRFNRTTASRARLVISDSLSGDVLQVLKSGATVFVTDLKYFDTVRPGLIPGYWVPSGQAGTAIAKHPAFGRFPHNGFLNGLWFRILDHAAKFSSIPGAEPLMMGTGSAGELVHVFQGRAGKGRLLVGGLKLTGTEPEAVCLLDELIRYACSDAFRPRTVLDLKSLEARLELVSRFNGWATTVNAPETFNGYVSYRGPLTMWVVRQNGGALTWKTAPVKLKAKAASHAFLWLAGFGKGAGPDGKFTVYLGGTELLSFRLPDGSQAWKSGNGKVTLRYDQKASGNMGASGTMTLVVPARLLEANQTAELKITGSNSNSSRWMGLYEVK